MQQGAQLDFQRGVRLRLIGKIGRLKFEHTGNLQWRVILNKT
jgi:hypothetical protein